MHARDTVRGLAAATALAMLLVACGQKPGVHVDAGPLAQGGQAPGVVGDLDAEPGSAGDGLEPGSEVGDGEDVDGPAEPVDIDGGSDDGGDGGPDGASASDGSDADGVDAEGGTGSDGGAPTASSGEGSGASTGTREPQGSDRTGVTDGSITLAIHAPVTGAAPLPATSFEKSRDLYWRWITEEKGQKVLGRSEVRVNFGDDRFEPNTAVQVCRQLASRAFALVGGGGSDQITACGRFAGQARVPYFSMGVNEAGLDQNPWYFAASMSYPQQTPLLAQYVARNFPGKKVGAIFIQTPNQDDAISSWDAARRQHDLPYTESLRHPKGNTSWYSGYARQLHEAGTEVIFMLTSPLDYIRFAQVADDAGYEFQYVGVGISKGLNDVLRSGCPQVDGGVFFSPFPAIETAPKLDPDFHRAARRFGVPDDDIAWALWGLAKVQHALFDRYEEVFGTDLTREDFRALVESTGKVETGVFPTLAYTPQDHFGGTAVHVLKADCGPRQYKDAGTFRSGF
jgi:ABC-type branched-subunit amino acid transport system substrate-binding protein